MCTGRVAFTFTSDGSVDLEFRLPTLRTESKRESGQTDRVFDRATRKPFYVIN